MDNLFLVTEIPLFIPFIIGAVVVIAAAAVIAAGDIIPPVHSPLIII